MMETILNIMGWVIILGLVMPALRVLACLMFLH